ncbi:hypothetical protein [Klebsiella pneumoniae]|uniref:hypothetical protein n=1 Tax=Klebsiella pneumoniae TaxID=573 RepID=UPI003B268A6A
MTKSTITRERVVALIAEHSYDSALVDALEHLLAAMDSEPVAEVYQAPNVGICAALGPSISMLCPLEPGTKLYRHPQPAPAVPELRVDWQENEFSAGWNACRAAMLQAEPVCTCPSGDGSLRWPCPVHLGNSLAIPDSARDALEKALAAMEFMGDTLNNLDAVCTEDVELVAPAFDAVRSVLASSLQEGK